MSQTILDRARAAIRYIGGGYGTSGRPPMRQPDVDRWAEACVCQAVQEAVQRCREIARRGIADKALRREIDRAIRGEFWPGRERPPRLRAKRGRRLS